MKRAMEGYMRSIIVTVLAFSCLLIGTVAVVQAQEIPETFLTVDRRLQDHALQSADYFNEDASRLDINRKPSCAVLGHEIYPCE
jgi:hypothetical protein